MLPGLLFEQNYTLVCYFFVLQQTRLIKCIGLIFKAIVVIVYKCYIYVSKWKRKFNLDIRHIFSLHSPIIYQIIFISRSLPPLFIQIKNQFGKSIIKFTQGTLRSIFIMSVGNLIILRNHSKVISVTLAPFFNVFNSKSQIQRFVTTISVKVKVNSKSLNHKDYTET